MEQRVAKYRLGGGMRGGGIKKMRRGGVVGCVDGAMRHGNIWEECIDWGVEKGWQKMDRGSIGREGRRGVVDGEIR